MIKINNDGNISNHNLKKKNKSFNDRYISKINNDLQMNNLTDTTKNKIKKIKTQKNFYGNHNNYISEKESIFKYNHIYLENPNYQIEKSININNISEEMELRKKILNYSNLSNKKKKSNLNDKKSKTPFLLNYNKKRKIFDIKNQIKDYSDNLTRKNINYKNDKGDKNKSKKINKKKIYQEKSQKNFRTRNYIQKNNIYNKKSRSFDNLNNNILDINKIKIKKDKFYFIKVNKISINNDKKSSKKDENEINIDKKYNHINNEYGNKNSKINYQTKTLENDEKILQNKINNKIQIKTNKQKPKEYNIFLDKEYQKRFVKKPKEIKVNYETYNSEKQRKYNTIFSKNRKCILNDLTLTVSSDSTNNSSHGNNRDWVYRLYNEEINKKKLENKIITSIRKSILKKETSTKATKKIKTKENAKYYDYENYKNINKENNFINNLLLSTKKSMTNNKIKKNSCLNPELNNIERRKEEKKSKLNEKLRKRYKKNFYLCNDELIDEVDEEKEFDREEN